MKYYIIGLTLAAILSHSMRAQNSEMQTLPKDCPTCPEMVLIPPGSFTMGNNIPERAVEKPLHEVKIDYQVAVGRYPITVGQFRQFILESGYFTPNFCWTIRSNAIQYGMEGRDWDNPGFDQEDNHPVVCVSWPDVQAYLVWLKNKTGKNYRLLSEAEWEYVARGNQSEEELTDGDFFSNGNNGAPDEDCCIGAQSDKDRWLFTSPVDAFAPNNFGLHDMTGNVHQWVSDCVNGNYEGAPNDGSAWVQTVSFGKDWGVSGSITNDGQCLHRIARGTSWLVPVREQWHTRRSWWVMQYPFNFIGFRVAYTIEEE